MELTEEQKDWKAAILSETGPTFVHFNVPPRGGLKTGMTACISSHAIANPGSTVCVVFNSMRYERLKLISMVTRSLQNEGNVRWIQRSTERLKFRLTDATDAPVNEVHFLRPVMCTKGFPGANLFILYNMDNPAYVDFVKGTLLVLSEGPSGRVASFSHSDGALLREALGLLNESV